MEQPYLLNRIAALDGTRVALRRLANVQDGGGGRKEGQREHSGSDGGRELHVENGWFA